MNYLTSLSSGQILKAVRLLKRREALEKRLAAINRELDSIEGGSAPAESAAAPSGRRRGRPPGRPKKSAAKAPQAASEARAPRRRGAPGKLKGGIISAVKSAGKEGIKVGTLASKLKVKPANVFSWFYTTGKKIPQIKKVGEARYAWID